MLSHSNGKAFQLWWVANARVNTIGSVYLIPVLHLEYVLCAMTHLKDVNQIALFPLNRKVTSFTTRDAVGLSQALFNRLKHRLGSGIP